MKGMILIGFRGCGKSTLGRKLAERLGWEFRDLDEEWERKRQCTILSFVAQRGIDAFREEEAEHLRETLLALAHAPRPAILASGGGLVEWPLSRELLLATPWPKVYLEVPAEELWRRLEGAGERRKIGQLTDLGALRSLLEQRRPFYEKIATYRVGNQDINDALNQLESLANRA